MAAKNKTAFTLIELIMTVVLVAIVVIPSSIFIVESIGGAFRAGDTTVVVNLARMEIERTNNLAYAHADIAGEGITPIPDYEGYNYDLSREVAFIDGDTDIKEINVKVYPAGKLGNPEDLLATVITHRTSYAE